MAWSASGVFTTFVQDSFNRTAAFDLNADTFKIALYDNTGTPDKTVSAANSAYNAGQWVTGNEVTSSGQWAAGGVALASVTSTYSGSTYTFDAADTSSGSTATLANVYGGLIYDTTLTTPVSGQGVCFLYLGGANSVTNGTFTVVYSASGIFTVTV